MNPAATGRGMIAVAFIIGMFLLTMFFSGVEERQHNPNQSPESRRTDQFVEVNLERNRQGHYITSGTINNQPVEFLLDTGATDVVIPGAVAKRLGLDRGMPSQAMTANGPVTVYATRVDEISIGGIRLQDVRASINPAMAPPGVLLGMSALRHIEFNQKDGTLTLRQYSS